MRKLPSRKLLATLIAGALFVPQSGFSLGLGEIAVDSSLNQKLNAEIELLSATPEDTESLIVKLASRKEFSRAGLDRPYSLNDLRFKSEVINGTPYIKITSGSPIREPFLNFLVEVDWPNGHLLREYTILLDPPVFMMNTPADATESRPQADTSFRPEASVSAPSAAVAAQPVQAQPVQSQPVRSAAPTQSGTSAAFMPAPVVQQKTPQTVSQQASANKPPGSYRVKDGDTAWSLADAMRPDSNVTVPQMMFAILKKNPEAFNRENINGLKRGYILRMPDSAEIAAISSAQAQAMMNEHWALWRQYQQAQRGEQPVTAMQADTESTAADSAAGSGSDEARLAIVSAGAGASTSASKDPVEMSAEELRAELALARERVETERVEKEVLMQRIDQLEKNLVQNPDQPEGLISIEDKELSDVQSMNASAGDVSDQATSQVSEATTETVTDDQSIVDGEPEVASEAEMTQQAEADATEEGAADSEPSVAGDSESAGSQAANDAVFTDEVAATEAAAQQMPAQEAVEPVTQQTAAPAPVRETAADPLSQILNNPMLLAAAGGGLLFIAALIALIIKRRKAGSDDSEVKSGFADLENLADDVAAEKAGSESATEAAADMAVADEIAEEVSEQAVESAQADSEEAVAAEPVEEEEVSRDDVIAEADVYLAYGIYQQAEDLLKTAISDNPDRIDYRLKLAETHFAGKDADAFAEVAGEINNRVEQDSDEWQKVVTMGQQLCPDNAMFQGEAVDLGSVDSVLDDEPIGLDLPEEDIDSEVDALELPEMDEQEIAESQAEPAEEIEFDISETDAIDESEASDEFALDIDAGELDIQDEVSSDEIVEESLDLTDVDIGIDEETVESAEELTEKAEDSDIAFDLDDEAGAATEVAEQEEVSLDLSDEAEEIDIDLQLDEEPETAQVEDAEVEEDAEAKEEAVVEDNVAELEIPEQDEPTTVVSAANDSAEAEDLDDEGDFDLSSLDDVDEVSTKLDLARAYIDMGDHDGSRDILQEVLADGNDEQKQEANDLMKKLA